MKRAFEHEMLFLLVWLVFLNGCASWQPLDKPLSEESKFADLRVTLRSERVIELRSAYAKADTLYGTLEGVDTAISVQDIESVEELHANTGSILVGVSAFIAVGIYLVMLGESGLSEF